MGVINLLESNVYNQISAGEVVENPASIVKELVENSIDSGAQSITVTISEGGIKSIIIADDGCGMGKKDLKMCILPHATSKIRKASDLDTIATLGFRGEALASIAAVSEVEIKSCHDGCANLIAVKANEIIEQKQTTLNKGTIIKVSSLFFNTPARYKFLKSPKSEETIISRLILELIFANPHIAFKYVADNKVIYQTQGNGMEKVMFSVYDAEFANNMVFFKGERSGYIVEGYTARPASSAIKSNRRNQIIIINGRSINNINISAVIQNAYTDKLMKRTFPSFIIDIIAPFDMIDVNVHPNKKEVRFAESRIINGLIYHTILDALNNDEQIISSNLFQNIYSMEKSKNEEELEMVFSALPSEKESLTEYSIETPLKESFKHSYEQFSEKQVDINAQQYGPNGLEFKDEVETISVFKLSDIITTPPIQDDFCTDEKPIYRIIGQVFDCYLIIEFSDKLFFIDQHAVHEKILYNRIVEGYEKNSQTQDLFIPYEIEFQQEDIEYVKESIGVLKKLGFNIKISKNGIRVHGIPAMLLYLDIPAFFNQLVNEKENGLTNNVIKEKIAQIACKSAIKGGDKLSNLQVKYVLDYFLENDIPMQCPHGRPTICQLTKTDIEKMFKRIV